MRRRGSTLAAVGLVLSAAAAGIALGAPPDAAPEPETEEIVPPQIILKTQVPPEFPPVAKAARMGASVTVKAVVQTDGTVGKVEVLHCTRPNLGFEEATIAAIKAWRFEPATHDGEPVEWERSFRLNFRDDGDVAAAFVPAGSGPDAHPGEGDAAQGDRRPRPPAPSGASAGSKPR